MRDEIRRYEAISRRLDPDWHDRESMTKDVVAYAKRFLAQLPDLGAYDGSTSAGDESQFTLDSKSGNLGEILALFDRSVATPGINPASGGHFGYIPGSGIYPSALGDFIADVTNRYSGVYFASPGAVLMERSLVRWMSDLLGYPDTAGGDLASGGSIANLSAIVTARDVHRIRAADVARSVVYLTEQTHHCIDKALRIAGLAECVVRRVPMCKRWRMIPDALESAIKNDIADGLKPWLVVASAGTTSTGSVDPLGDVADITEKYELWFHCEAAYGGFFLLTDRGREALKGIERSHSTVMDPHKGLFLPFGTGALLVRDEKQLADSHHYTANYMQDAEDAGGAYSPADLSPELSRPFRGLRMWLPLKLFGLQAFRACLDEKLSLARYFHQELARVPGFEMGPEPDLSVVTYRFVPEEGDADEFNRRLLAAVHEDGKTFITSTLLNGHYTLRLAALHFRSHLDEVDYLLELLRYEARKLLDG